jgi:hypothetical protein
MHYLVYNLDGKKITEYFLTEEDRKKRVNQIFNKVTGLYFGFEPKDHERKNRD